MSSESRASVKPYRKLAPDELIDQWRTHIAIVADDVLYLDANRRKFTTVERLFATHPDLNHDSEVFRWIWRMWGTEAVMGIRRELDDQHGVLNLKNLLYQLEERADILTRERFLESSFVWCCDIQGRAALSKRFDTYGITRTRDEVNDHLNPGVPRSDRAYLQQEAAEAFHYANLLIAHRTPRDPDIYEASLNRAINAIVKLTRKYYLILNSNEKRLKGVVIKKDWTKPFQKAWIPEGRQKQPTNSQNKNP